MVACNVVELFKGDADSISVQASPKHTSYDSTCSDLSFNCSWRHDSSTFYMSSTDALFQLIIDARQLRMVPQRSITSSRVASDPRPSVAAPRPPDQMSVHCYSSLVTVT